MAQTKISDIIESSLANLKEMIDANTVVGKPIDTGTGTVIIPISKVSMGFASGGLDYPGKQEKQPGAQGFGGGGGTGLTVSPVAFLVIKENGDADILNLGGSSSSDGLAAVSAFMEKSPELFSKIKSVFSSGNSKKEKKEKKETAAPNDEEIEQTVVIEETVAQE